MSWEGGGICPAPAGGHRADSQAQMILTGTGRQLPKKIFLRGSENPQALYFGSSGAGWQGAPDCGPFQTKAARPQAIVSSSVIPSIAGNVTAGAVCELYREACSPHTW